MLWLLFGLLVVLLLWPRQKSLTIVSAYYEIPSKRSAEEYHERLKRFLGSVDCDMVFYTSGDLVETLKSYRTRFLDRTRFIVIELEDLEFMKKYGLDFWKDQCKKYSHDVYTDKPLLGGIWYSKNTLLRDAIDKNPFGTSHFAWVDAGIMDTEYNGPVLRVNPNMLRDDNIMNVYTITTLPSDIKFFDWTMPDYIAGDTFYGSTEACKGHLDSYSEEFDKYLAAGKSVYMDQNIMTSSVVNNRSEYHVEETNGAWRTLFRKMMGQ